MLGEWRSDCMRGEVESEHDGASYGTLATMARRTGTRLACWAHALPRRCRAPRCAAGGRRKSAAQRLIDAYTPRLMVRERDEICDTSGEQYEATSVEHRARATRR